MGVGGEKIEAYLLKGNNSATAQCHQIILSNIAGIIIILIIKGVDCITSSSWKMSVTPQ